MDSVIIDCMKERDARLCLGHRWLVCDEIDRFSVYERKPYAKTTKTIYEGEILNLALEALEDGW